MSKSKVICILGMHRSGTSLLSQWLFRCGLNLGDRLLSRDFSNQKGHFEDLDFLEVHKQILQFNNLDPSGLIGLKELKLNKYYQKKIDHLIDLKCDLNQQWGWKDPRTCLIIEEYKRRIPDLKVLVVYRSYIKIINSLINRDIKRYFLLNGNGFKKQLKSILFKRFIVKKLLKKNGLQYINATKQYFESILSLVEKSSENVVIIGIDDLLERDVKIFNLIVEKWGFNLSYIPFNELFIPMLQSGKNFYSSLESHYKSELKQLAILDGNFQSIKDTFK